MAWPSEAGAVARVIDAARLRSPGRRPHSEVISPSPYRGRCGASWGAPYRIFTTVGYRLYRRLGEPPREDDTPFATSEDLPIASTPVWADGDWYIALSYFNGVLDSGFLPLAEDGKTYQVLTISGGIEQTRPAGPLWVSIRPLSSTSARITVASWTLFGGLTASAALAYTQDGSEPTDDPTEYDLLVSYPVNHGLAILERTLTGLTASADLRVRCWNVVVGAGLPGPRIFSIEHADARRVLPGAAPAAAEGAVIYGGA